MYIFQNSITFLYKKTFSAFIPPAICLCMLHFVGCHRYLVVVLLCATLGINGFNFSAVTCNQLDIAPKFAGTLMGITNSVGNIMGFLAPQISGAILNGHVSLYSKHFQFRYDGCRYLSCTKRRFFLQEDRTHWEVVFFTAAGAYVIGSLLFCLMGSGEEQPWSRIESDKRTASNN